MRMRRKHVSKTNYIFEFGVEKSKILTSQQDGKLLLNIQPWAWNKQQVMYDLYVTKLSYIFKGVKASLICKKIKKLQGSSWRDTKLKGQTRKIKVNKDEMKDKKKEIKFNSIKHQYDTDDNTE